jgi:hypothetical protein
MQRRLVSRIFAILALLLVACNSVETQTRSGEPRPQDSWKIHDPERPQPNLIDPGTPARAPSDAIALFDGKDLSHWRSGDGPAKWKVENGYVEVVKGAGSLVTRQAYGDCQLHIEWMSPQSSSGTGQNRGNSGVFMMGIYEVQVLDSHQNKTYPDGQAASIYGQYPPMVNASRAPGEWQSYDIIFRRPRFDKDGKLLRPARMTVLHNGIVVHDNVELTGPTAHNRRPEYKPHADKLPISLQDHGDPVRFRNIWIRELSDE